MTHPTDALRLDDVLFYKLKDLITEQSEGEWDDVTIIRDAHHFANHLRPLLSAAPASPLQGGGWQDISTAPKDGTTILTYGSLHNDGAPYGIGETPTVKISQYSQEGEFWCCDAWGSHEPVWWMPLPAAPTGAK